MAYRRSDVETLAGLSRVVNGSSTTNTAVRYPAWCWRDWKTFLAQHFKTIRGIRKYQYFRMSAARPGIVVVKERTDGPEQEVNVLRNTGTLFPTDARPETVAAAGLSEDRRKYLRQYVSPHVSQEHRGWYM